jgi:Alb1
VSKKRMKQKTMSRAQRLRQQKGIERAEIVVDQLERKVASGIRKATKVKARKVRGTSAFHVSSTDVSQKATWDDLNRNRRKSTAQPQVEVQNENEVHMAEDDLPAPPNANNTFVEPAHSVAVDIRPEASELAQHYDDYEIS